MEGSGGEESYDVQCKQPSGPSSIPIGGGHGTGTGTTSTSKVKTKGKKQLLPEFGPLNVCELLYQYPTCPPSSYMNIKEFFNNPNVNYITNNCKYAEVHVRNWCSKLNWWTIQDFELYYADPKVKPYFNAYNRPQTEVYYTVEESVNVASKLLEFQFFNSSENINYFLTDLLNVVDKKIPKLNTLAILADPNAGKNYFFDAVACFFINYGCIGTANKTNVFAFQEAAGKRLVLWNEPNYEAVHIEKLKELLAGDTTRVHVKYQKDTPLQGPPIIILTNDNLSIFGMSAFQSRIKLYKWRSAPFLKEYDKKINPLFLLPLFNKYNIPY